MNRIGLVPHTTAAGSGSYDCGGEILDPHAWARMHGAAGVAAVTSLRRELVQDSLAMVLHAGMQADVRVEGDDCGIPTSFPSSLHFCHCATTSTPLTACMHAAGHSVILLDTVKVQNTILSYVSRDGARGLISLIDFTD